MANELTKREEGLVDLVSQNNLGDLLKPLITEIHLFDTFVAGTTHLEDESVLENLKVGDRLALIREENKFDSNAVMIMDRERRKVGYVPERDNVIFARLMDAGKCLQAQITEIEMKGAFMKISIGIYLVDF